MTPHGPCQPGGRVDIIQSKAGSNSEHCLKDTTEKYCSRRVSNDIPPALSRHTRSREQLNHLPCSDEHMHQTKEPHRQYSSANFREIADCFATLQQPDRDGHTFVTVSNLTILTKVLTFNSVISGGTKMSKKTRNTSSSRIHYILRRFSYSLTASR